MSYFGATSTPVFDFWFSKVEWVLPYSHGRGECNVYSLKPTCCVVLYIANLLMDSIAEHQPGSYLAQGYYWHYF